MIAFEVGERVLYQMTATGQKRELLARLGEVGTVVRVGVTRDDYLVRFDGNKQRRTASYWITRISLVTADE